MSLERYRSIIRNIRLDLNRHPRSSTSLQFSLSLPAILQFVWMKAESKRCILDFLLAMELTSSQAFLSDEFSDVRVDGSEMQQSWLDLAFEPEQLTDAYVYEAANYICKYDGRLIDELHSSKIGYCFEVLTAFLSQGTDVKSPIKLGRYGYLGGLLKPDCVEVTVREVIDSLIFGNKIIVNV